MEIWEEAFSEPGNTLFERYGRYVNPEFVRLLGLFDCRRNFVRARDAYLWDEKGERYLDFGEGGSHNAGYNNQKIIRALRRLLAREVPNFVQYSPEHLPAVLAEELSKSLPGGDRVSILTNSGSEAVDAALKLARLATGRRNIVFTSNSYHGCSIGGISVTGIEKLRSPFGPLLQGCIEVPFGDVAGLRRALRPKTSAAFIVEPIQGVGGIIPAPPGYFKAAAQVCADTGTIFVLDEIITGMGRLGALTYSNKHGLSPDVILLAKSLSAGLLPIGAAVAKRSVWQRAFGTMERSYLQLGIMSTFGAGNLASACGLLMLETLKKTPLLEDVRRLSEHLLSGLLDLKKRHGIIKDIRGEGMLLGVELDRPVEGLLDSLTLGMLSRFTDEIAANWIASRMLCDHNIVVSVCFGRPNVIRVEPPLVVREADVTHFLESFDSTLRLYPNFRKILRHSWKPVARNIRGR